MHIIRHLGGMVGGSRAGAEKNVRPVNRWIMKYYFPEEDVQLNPCIQDGTASMWSCKTVEELRVMSREIRVEGSSLMIIFAPAEIRKGAVLFVLLWQRTMGKLKYLRKNPGRFDSMYDPDVACACCPGLHRKPELTHGGEAHRNDENDNRRGGDETDYMYDQKRTVVLLTNVYREFTDGPQLLPRSLEHLCVPTPVGGLRVSLARLSGELHVFTCLFICRGW